VLLQVLQEASLRERQQKQQPADISQFLAPVGVWELKHLRKLAHLTALTYLLHLVTVRSCHCASLDPMTGRLGLACCSA
jgi:hypothetical protein